jgi:integrase
LIRNAGLPSIRFRDLRHTAASLMLNNNIAPITVSRRLGHAKASITLDVYGHLIPTMQNDLGDRIDECVTPVPVQLEQKVEPGS